MISLCNRGAANQRRHNKPVIYATHHPQFSYQRALNKSD